jgi:PAS domain S-box-containing protein
MLEFKVYDKVFYQHESNSDTKKMPLTTWDIYGDFLNQLNKMISDQNQLELLATFNGWKTDFVLKDEINVDTVVVVTCPKLKIVFSTKNMLKMNGYHPEEVLGKSPKMFQGEATCKQTSKEIGIAVHNRQPFEKTVTNYRKDGLLYRCHIKGFPIFNKSGELTNFIAFEKAA